MKTIIRFQSRLLVRRSYKPARSGRRNLGVTFRPAPRFVVRITEHPARASPLQMPLKASPIPFDGHL